MGPVDEDRYREAERALWASVDVQPTEVFVTLDRTSATVRVQQVGDGPPIVFVHGASNAGTSWASLAAGLGDFRCILIDRPGCGLSPRLIGNHADLIAFGRFADDLVVDVLDAFGITDAHVIGTSLGGYFAIRTAAVHPDRVRRLVTLSWSFGAPTVSTPMVMRVATQPFLGRLALRIPPNERMVRSMLKRIGLRHAVESGRFGAVETAWFLSLLRDTDTMRNEIDATPRILTWRGFNEETRLPTDVLASVRCPAFFLWGEDDPMGGAEIAEEFVASFPDAHLELMPDAGHAPWIDDPDHVADRVGSFLRS